MNISIIGGDLRIARLAEMYAKENYNIYTYGLEDFFNKKKKETWFPARIGRDFL